MQAACPNQISYNYTFVILTYSHIYFATKINSQKYIGGQFIC